jgi:putative transposase
MYYPPAAHDDQPIFPNRLKDITVERPNQSGSSTSFAYVAVILGAWSRRVTGYAISPSIDVRLMLAAL